jgi:hypothetical protein
MNLFLEVYDVIYFIDLECRCSSYKEVHQKEKK